MLKKDMTQYFNEPM